MGRPRTRVSTSCSGLRWLSVACNPIERWSASVSGGCTRARGQSLQAMTVFSSEA